MNEERPRFYVRTVRGSRFYHVIDRTDDAIVVRVPNKAEVERRVARLNQLDREDKENA
jgi:hypothetical protein